MALKYRSTEVYLKPDPRFRSTLIGKFTNCMMRKGKKSTSQRIFYKAMDIVAERVEDKEPLEVFEEAIGNVKPIIEVRSRRVGGMTYQVPTEVRAKRQVSLAVRWVLEAVRRKKGRPAYMKLADEILDAYHRQGTAYEGRENSHKMAEANRAFAHFSLR